MRHFTVTWDPKGSLELLRARAFLGPGRAEDLDDELEAIRVRLEALPESGAQVLVRGEWSSRIRKVPLTHAQPVPALLPAERRGGAGGDLLLAAPEPAPAALVEVQGSG